MARFRVTAYDDSIIPKKLSDKTYSVENVARAKAKLLERRKEVKAIFINDIKVY